MIQIPPFFKAQDLCARLTSINQTQRLLRVVAKTSVYMVNLRCSWVDSYAYAAFATRSNIGLKQLTGRNYSNPLYCVICRKAQLINDTMRAEPCAK